MKKIITLFILFVFSFTSFPKLIFAENDIDPERDSLPDFETQVKSINPQFTVAPKSMIKREKAVSLNKSSISATFNICSNKKHTSEILKSNLCLVKALFATTKTTFQSGGFDWYLWYEVNPKKKEAFSIKTKMAKFPINKNKKQSSYALYTFDGGWTSFHINSEIFSLIRLEYLNPYSEDTHTLMFYNPNKDNPLFFSAYHESRYGLNQKTYYIYKNLLVVLNQKYPSDKKLLLFQASSLKDGSSFDLKKLNIEDIQKKGIQISDVYFK